MKKKKGYKKLFNNKKLNKEKSKVHRRTVLKYWQSSDWTCLVMKENNNSITLLLLSGKWQRKRRREGFHREQPG